MTDTVDVDDVFGAQISFALSAATKIGPGGEFDKPEDRFIDACLRFLSDWGKKHGTETEQPALLLHHDGSKLSSEIPSPQKQTGFRAALPQDLPKHVYFCNENLKKVSRLAAEFKNYAEALDFVQDKGLTNFTAVVFIPGQKALLIHRTGQDLDDAERHDLTPMPGVSFDFTNLGKELDFFDKMFLGSDAAHCRIWNNAGKRILNAKPEGQIQGSLLGYFQLRLLSLGIKTDQEVHTFKGRADVRLIKYNPDNSWETVIIELKVLTKDKNDAKNLEWALKGIAQLKGYRTATLDCKPLCVLSCYDGRTVDVELDGVLEAATTDDVVYRRHFLATSGFPAAAP